ncbi:MAG: SoxR reducing system RseC family protein [Pseudomonadota bacterium]
MAVEEGYVVRLEGDGAWVKTRRCEACDHCAAKDGCRTLGGGKEVELRVENTLGAGPGDHVAVGVSDASFLKATFLVYFLPVLGLLGGAILGDWAGPRMNLDATAASVVMAFGGCALVFAGVRVAANRLAEKPAFQPRLEKILDKAGS